MKTLLVTGVSRSVHVNALRPGLIDTEIHATSGIGGRLKSLVATVPMARIGTSDEVAETILWLLSDAASYVNGAIVDISGGR